jgi:hypothetical protein
MDRTVALALAVQNARRIMGRAVETYMTVLKTPADAGITPSNITEEVQQSTTK